ncbi:hypothetical protein ACRC7T_15630 [Segnochrobactraceae bacterium EtOH-i3]
MSAQTGADALDFFKGQAAITNAWAAEDRERYQSRFVPLQDAYIKKAQGWDSAARQAQVASEAKADVMSNAAAAQQQNQRQRPPAPAATGTMPRMPGSKRPIASPGRTSSAATPSRPRSATPAGTRWPATPRSSPASGSPRGGKRVRSSPPRHRLPEHAGGGYRRWTRFGLEGEDGSGRGCP